MKLSTAQPQAATLSLHAVPMGNSCTLSPLNEEILSIELRRRLAELGLRGGSRIVVTQKTAAGGRVVKVGATRYAIDGVTAKALQVEP